MAGILDALNDPEFRRQIGLGVRDATNRGIGMAVGAPVDLAGNVINLLIAGGGFAGHQLGLIDSPPELIDPKAQFGSSEWIGQKMQDAGMVSELRNPLAETLASIAIPMAMQKGALALGSQLAKAEQVASTHPRMRAQSQRGVITFPESMTRPQKSEAIKTMAESAAQKLREYGFSVDLQHSGSAMGPSSYIRVSDPQTGRFIQDPLRISDHSKGAFNSKLVHDASSQDDINRFFEAAMEMRKLGPSESFIANQRFAADHADKVRQSWMIVYERAMDKQKSGIDLSRKEKQAIDWVAKNQTPQQAQNPLQSQ
jgi:hypothetical protein